jgi:ribosomal-protein-alanine N-acetyltransferase
MRAPNDDLLPREFPGGRLRRLRPADLATFQAYRALPELGRYQGWSPMADAEALAFLSEMSEAPLFAPGRWVQLGIAAAASDGLVGDIGIHLSDDGFTGEIGFTLAPASQGRGIATAAVRQALQVLVASTAVAQVLGITDGRNAASIRLLERLGFAPRESRELVFRGERCREQIYALRPERVGTAR